MTSQIDWRKKNECRSAHRGCQDVLKMKYMLKAVLCKIEESGKAPKPHTGYLASPHIW